MTTGNLRFCNVSVVDESIFNPVPLTCGMGGGTGDSLVLRALPFLTHCKVKC